MRTTQPTTGPWTAIQADVHGDADDPDPSRWSVMAGDHAQYCVATIENGAPGDLIDTEAANAALIVRAVNAHASLIEALERCQVRIFMLEGRSEEYELAREALKLAKGGV